MAKVESISKFGFVAGGKKYRYDDVAIDRAMIVPGAEIDLAVKQEAVATATLAPVKDTVDTERAKVFTPKFNQSQAPSNAMSRADWDAKDKRISRQGVIQVAVQVMGDWNKAVELADKMLNYVNEVK